MAKYMEHKRDTELFVAGSLEGLLPEDSVARAIWAGLEQLDLGLYDALYKVGPRGRGGGIIVATVRLVDLGCGRRL